MKISELKGYKNEPLYKSAKKIFDPETLRKNTENRLKPARGFFGKIFAQFLPQKTANSVDDKVRQLYARANTREDALELFYQELKIYGFEELGRGQGGLAFIHPSYPLACKIFSQDSGYMDFLRYAQSHQSNPHVPKFRGKMMKINEDTFVVRMERLFPIKDNLAFELAISELSPVKFRHEFEQKLKNSEFPVLSNKLPQMLTLISDLFKMFPGSRLDFHDKNVLQRKDGTIVLIDPFYNLT